MVEIWVKKDSLASVYEIGRMGHWVIWATELHIMWLRFLVPFGLGKTKKFFLNSFLLEQGYIVDIHITLRAISRDSDPHLYDINQLVVTKAFLESGNYTFRYSRNNFTGLIL